ncbi:molecular chaperone HtpG [Myxococcus sp. CA051A]|uniref:Chaperone protein HtpG n=1 Tax=Myxococcus llanfairpwllgwyngyllgogerychwyrndrobwllllantysiliogogogochensis TaxID=2590453 RepID=A0A540WJU4_9BACT|nr:MULTISPECIES: molecular chaperone HtpG [Myxococcus]NTX00280.1 molecular chaperone HtpG [Myxococcus sp. CA040A]NTX15772.1 molecular chaperone HtpG [Myxococcus sp. CA056]NTX65359.1 molecular chaperone HtpG [Myxococcus sp. CA051A]TQF09261.1 molecular chaperone HtpG [Myxococcus llanfairpwllgwyngyllgogerychwyrndrobwllllantysiliogogogochensis]
MTVEAAPQRETHAFQAEINQLLSLVINSLYSHKEIFLRELVSNASDALDKLRFRAITEPELLSDAPELELRITPDAEKNTLTIEDTGIGMSHDELVKNLGTIAHSGSREFLQMATQRGQKDVQLIGQFGVGFYSAYLVADRVEVVSRAAGKDSQAWKWSSEAHGSFTVEPAERAARGTAVILHLKEDQKEFLDEWRVRSLITQYSDYVGHPIKLQVKKTTGTGDDAKTEVALEVVNKASALWQRSKSEITDEQYQEFYKHLTHDWDVPLAWTHFRADGNQQFTGLLFVPKNPPFDLNAQQQRGVRLFVKRVFIMDRCEELVPQWLRFVRGVIDSDDLPLNVSRELLQDSQVVRAIRKHVVKKSLDLLEKLAKDKPEDYTAFWKSFGTVLKEGLATEAEHKDKLGGLLRYESSREEGLTSLSDYVSRMKEGQEALYYMYGESRKAVEDSPHLEALKQRGYEVLFMTDPVDEWAAQGLREFQGKPLVSALQADLKLQSTDEQKKEHEQNSEGLKGLTAKMKDVLQDSVREVRVSDRLTDSPVCLVVPEGGSPAYLERLLQQRGKGMPRVKRILEVNPKHPVIEHLKAVHEKDPAQAQVSEWIELLHDQALLTEGSTISDPNRFARRLTSLLTQVAGQAAKAPVPEVPAPAVPTQAAS